MQKKLTESLELVKKTLSTAENYHHAEGILSFDLETICPKVAMEKQGETMAFLSSEAFKLVKSDEFIQSAEALYEGRGELDEKDRCLAEHLHREYARTKNISPGLQHEFTLASNRAYIDWLDAKNASDYEKFVPSLEKMRDLNMKFVSLRDERPKNSYDTLLDDYERGMSSDDLDEAFGKCKERLLPLLQKIMKSKKIIRSDFLSRRVTDAQQKEYADYLLDVMKYDKNRGVFATTEHPFTSDIARDDVRVTTHYYENAFTSSMYSIIHEGGHALFGQLQPAADHDAKIANRMTMGMHESVSRFYENRLGRSEAFISHIYDDTKRIFPGLLDDVSKRELYEAVNIVRPSLIRTEADEFTYTFHIIIRYEIEKMIINEGLDIRKVPKIWNDKYEEYLGIRPGNDKEGALQDVHWTFSFGYFPTYALGNMYNAMYFNRMKKELDTDSLLKAGDFGAINGWMEKNVFAKANMLSPGEWIKDITGRDFTPDDFLDYLEDKYTDLYEL